MSASYTARRLSELRRAIELMQRQEQSLRRKCTQPGVDDADALQTARIELAWNMRELAASAISEGVRMEFAHERMPEAA